MTEKETYEQVGRLVVHHLRTNKPFRYEFNRRKVGEEVGAVISAFYEGVELKKLPFFKRLIERTRRRTGAGLWALRETKKSKTR